jgi:RNA polymerase sigma factor (TIGR02999 family)
VNSESAPGSVTQMLTRWQQGDERAFSELAPIVYAELKGHARRYLRRERRDHTLQGTALVHEALLRLMHGEPIKWTNRAHFLHLVSKLMRRILVDHARSRLAAKRNSGVAAISLSEIQENRIQAQPDTDFDHLLGGTLVNQDVSTDVCGVDQALERLSAVDARQAQLVELRFFGGMTIDETALALGISAATVKREWTVARAWLQRELQQVV